MTFNPRLLPQFALIALCSTFAALPLKAQEANVLGLPAIPQPKPGSAPAAAPAVAASGAGSKAAQAPAAATPNNRSALAGELGVQHSSRDGMGTIVFTTRTVFQTGSARSDAIEAARAVQRDLGQACVKQCQPSKMPAPKILPSGQLEFALAFKPLHQTLSQAQFMAALQSQPMNLTTAQLTAPIVSVAPAVSVQIAPAASNTTPAASPTQ